MRSKRSKRSEFSGVERISMPLTIRKLLDEYLIRIDLDADYQRERVWNRTQQEELLDSMINGIDIPKLYLAKVSNNKQFDYECIDGKQRLLTISNFFDPDEDDAPLHVEVLSKKYTYDQLLRHHRQIAEALENFTLDFVVYDEENLTEEFVRKIFRRLQLGIRLNSGELLNSQLGAIRDFVFKENGKDGPFLRRTRLSDKRFSRQFTLAQICINSFSKASGGDFVRARLSDLQDFFDSESGRAKSDTNFVRIRKALSLMDLEFGDSAQLISSRAVAVSAYLFVEELLGAKKQKLVKSFASFLSSLLNEIASDMALVSQYKEPNNSYVLDAFQKYVLQASVEPYSIRRRHEFLGEAFAYFIAPKTKGKIIDKKPEE